METTALKLIEEAGELSQAISKFRGLNGEKIHMTDEEVMDKITSELLDVMQVCATMTYVLEKDNKIDLKKALKKHKEKMIKKGYVKSK
ncbi:MAG: MazG-like family protein [Fusobacteriota bacterium]